VVRASAQPLCPRRLYGFRLNLPKRRGAADAEAPQRHETEPAPLYNTAVVWKAPPP